MRKAALYMRVSSDKQAKEGDSIPAQRDALRKYIAEHDDLTLAGEYIDDGVSGQKSKRDELQRLLDDVRAGRVNIILFTKLDRWFRSVRHYTATQEILDKQNVGWLAIWEPIYDTTTPAGRLIVNQMMSIAQFEAENTGQRIRQVQAYKVTQGEVISGSTPPGYKIVAKHLVPDELAPAVVEAFRTYSVTGSLNETMMLVQGLGLPRAKPGFKLMLKNSLYIGLYRGNPDFCPPLVGKDLFYDVQRKLSMNVKKSQHNVYIFSGLLKCGECGCRMGGNLRKRQRKNSISEVKQYRCSKRFNERPHGCPNGKVVTEHALETYLIGNLRTLAQNVKVSHSIQQAAQVSAEKQRAAVQAKLDRLKALYLDGLIGIDEYKSDKETLVAQMDALQDPEPVRDYAALDALIESGIEKMYFDLSPDEKRYIWRSVIKEIRMGIDRVYHVDFL